MAGFNFITVRLGKDSIPDINQICSSYVGILSEPLTINVKCTQVPDNYGHNDYAFLWLGSDNNKGMPTNWKQGFKAVGRVINVLRGKYYNDTSETTIEIVYIFRESVNRMDILRCAPTAYYWCSSMPLIGLDDHANQTIRNMTGSAFADLRAFFSAIDSVTKYFKNDILQIESGFKQYFDYPLPNPQLYPDVKSLAEIGSKLNVSSTLIALQKIFYGAPGTGKSHSIKGDANVKEAEEGNRVFRTTFHPDSDYSTFVGCYKPSMKSGDKIYSAEELSVKLKEIKNTGVPYPCHKFAAKYWRSLKDLDPNSIKHILLACGFTEAYGVEVSKGIAIGQEFLNKDEDGKIIYTFTPQAFTNAYVKAWNTTENVYLIIEEINRGNCAQIFGDLFQLLDRGDDGKSEYPIDSDTDLGNYIAKELGNSSRSDFPDGVKDGKKLVLPPNLYIWATMNTSDQSLFPIDSAFKRRWDWKYLPIENAEKGWKIKVNGNEYDWYQFLEAINKEVLELTHSEDKQLGYFFAKAKGTTIDAETLVNKVYFYLWTDVFKDYDYESQKAFRKPNSNEPIAFKNFFEDLMEGEKVNERVAEQVLINLELEKLNKPQDLFE